MKYATLNEEKKLWKKGFKNVACLDEAGRGPLAGPVVAGAVMVRISNFQFPKLRDSKKLSPKRRGFFYNLITKNKNIKWGIGIVSEKVIDKMNILQATKLAMGKALKRLKPDYLILDGKMRLNLPIKQKAIVKADEKVFSCAAASIIAKVTRDKLMFRYHKKYPRYRFDLHKGYGTRRHLTLLKKYRPCKIHRNSFLPVRACRVK